MFFYIDESGNTGNNLFDRTQPVLSYGLLSCATNIDILGRGIHKKMLARLGVSELHANELREGGLVEIADLLFELHKQLRFDFDFYFVDKRDFALVTFFDHVFDNVLNPAVPWSWYQTPARYMLLMGLSELFDDELLEKTWLAATSVSRDKAIKALSEILPELLARIETRVTDRRAKQILRDTFTWANEHPEHLDFHASSKWQTHYMGPNLVGFQFVLFAIARRLRAKGKKAPNEIVVDRQHQYNAIQRDLQTHYKNISQAIKTDPFPSRKYLDRDMNAEFANMPERDFAVMASGASIGLQITDICLWLFSRYFLRKGVDARFAPFLERLFRRALADGIHMGGFAKRFSEFEAQLPALEGLHPEQVKKLLEAQESARQAALEEHRATLLTRPPGSNAES